MALGDIVEIPRSLFILLQAFGWAVIAYVIFQLINLKLNRKKNKLLEDMNRNLRDIKSLLKKKKR